MKKSYRLGLGVFSLTLWSLAGCGSGLNSPAAAGGGGTGGTVGGGGTSGPPALSMVYLDSTNSNAPIAVSASSVLPDPSAVISMSPDQAGLFDQTITCAHTANSDYVFKITNNGTGPLTAVGTSVEVTKTTDYATIHGHASLWSDLNSGTDLSFSVAQMPTLPLAVGASTTFTIRFTNAIDLTTYPGITTCGFAVLDGTFGVSIETAHVVVNTNDPTNPNFAVDLSIYGQS